MRTLARSAMRMAFAALANVNRSPARASALAMCTLGSVALHVLPGVLYEKELGYVELGDIVAFTTGLISTI